jgi:hypothetical protein
MVSVRALRVSGEPFLLSKDMGRGTACGTCTLVQYRTVRRYRIETVL